MNLKKDSVYNHLRKIVFKKTSLLLLLLLVLSLRYLQAQTTSAVLKETLQNRGDDTGKVNLLNTLSQFYLQTNLDSLKFFTEAAKSLSKKLKYEKGEADAYINYARYYENKGDYSSAMQNCLTGLHKYEGVQQLKELGNAYLLLANISKDLSGQNRTHEYIENGITYTKTARRIFEGLRDTAGVCTSLITAGIMYRDKSIKTDNPAFFDTAFASYTKALQLIKTSGKENKQLPRLYNNISQVYIEHFKDYNQALSYLFKAVELNKAGNNTSSLSFNYGNISNAYRGLHRYDKALQFAKMMLAVSRQLNRPNRIQNGLYQVFQVYDESGKPDSALRYYKLADKINDSLTDLSKTSQVMELQTKYETGKKELEIQQLHTAGLLKSRQITMLAVALVLVAVFTTAMVMLYRRVQKQKQQITLQSDKLAVMMKELHHRVKNNLQIVSSLLSLQTYKLTDEATISVLKESQQRVQAMSILHQRLYKTDDVTCINMKEYVTDLAETLLSAYGYSSDNFDLQLQIEKENLDVDKALPVGLIINEMVTNAMKYAYRGISFPLLKIVLADEGDNLVLTIKDNGKGIDEKAWKQKSNSFGKQLITALGKQLRASQTVVVDNGTQFTVIIPKQKAA